MSGQFKCQTDLILHRHFTGDQFIVRHVSRVYLNVRTCWDHGARRSHMWHRQSASAFLYAIVNKIVVCGNRTVKVYGFLHLRHILHAFAFGIVSRSHVYRPRRYSV